MTNINYHTESMSETRTRYTFENPCKLGGGLIVEFTRVETDNAKKNSLPNLWNKGGYINRVLPNYWSVDTFAYDGEGGCWGKFNPQTIPGSNKLNFDWMLEATEENRQHLLSAICAEAF